MKIGHFTGRHSRIVLQGNTLVKIRSQKKINNFAFFSFKIGKIIFQEKNLKHRKIILLINFYFARTFFLIASSQIFKNNAILINHGYFVRKKILHNLSVSNF